MVNCGDGSFALIEGVKLTMSRIWRLLVPTAITMAAAGLATFRLGYEPLWTDEAWTFFKAHQSIPEMAVIYSIHNPFYYVVMKIWLSFGDSEFWMRLSSMLCFTLTVPVVYVIGRTVSGRRAGLYAACLAATAPFLIHHAQNARMYAMLTLFCSLALMSVALIISRQSGRPPPIIGSGLRGQWHRWRRGAAVSRSCGGEDVLWAVYIVAVFGGMISHNTAILLPVVTTLIFLVAIAAAPRFRWLRLRNLIYANTVVLVLYVFFVPLLLSDIENIGKQYTPISISLETIRWVFRWVYGNKHLPVQAVALSALCVLALWGWRRRGDWRWFGFTLIGALGLPLMLLAASAVFKPIFVPRIIIWASIPFYVGCAVGIGWLPNAGLRRVVLVGLLVCNLYGVLNEYESIREPWDEVAQVVAKVVSSDDAVVLCNKHGAKSFNYYWRRHGRELSVFGGEIWKDKLFLVRPYLEAAGGEVSKWLQLGDEPHTLEALLNDYSGLWIIVRNYNRCGSTALRDLLSDRVQLVKKGDFKDGHIELFAVRAD